MAEGSKGLRYAWVPIPLLSNYRFCTIYGNNYCNQLASIATNIKITRQDDQAV